MLENNSRVHGSLLHLRVSSGTEMLSEEDLVDSGMS